MSSACCCAGRLHLIFLIMHTGSAFYASTSRSHWVGLRPPWNSFPKPSRIASGVVYPWNASIKSVILGLQPTSLLHSEPSELHKLLHPELDELLCCQPPASEKATLLPFSYEPAYPFFARSTYPRARYVSHEPHPIRLTNPIPFVHLSPLYDFFLTTPPLNALPLTRTCRTTRTPLQILWRCRYFSSGDADISICVTWLIHLCDMTHQYAWHDSSICVTWLIHMCDMTHPYVWHDSSTSVTCRYFSRRLGEPLRLSYRRSRPHCRRLPANGERRNGDVWLR